MLRAKGHAVKHMGSIGSPAGNQFHSTSPAKGMALQYFD